MPRLANRWTLILAAGSGTRLHGLTSDGRSGPVPKQFCSLNGGPSLLEETLARAHAFSAKARTLVVVVAEHRTFWRHALAHAAEENVIVQPRNRGTANGILLGVTAIAARDPEGLVTILPSDHFVAHEDVLRRSLSHALALAESRSGADSIHVLGIEPEAADPELSYIVRGERRPDSTVPIARFVEKPSRDEAERLLRDGALWNSFILVARAAALLGLIERSAPVQAAAFARLSWGGPAARLARELTDLYGELPEIDFSRGVMEGSGSELRVVPVPYCGWSDLGTPQRLADCLGRADARPAGAPSGHFNLAQGYARLISAITAAPEVA